MSYREFAEWQAYWSLEPFGVESWQMADLMSLTVAMRSSRKGKRYKTIDFMPRGTREIKPKPESVARSFYNWLKVTTGIKKRET